MKLTMGNWLQYRDKDYCQVSNVGHFFATERDGVIYGSDDITDYNPITLTPEILRKISRVEVSKWYDESGTEFKEETYHIAIKTAKLTLRFHDDELFFWIQYEFDGRPRYHSSELFYYERQLVFRRKGVCLHNIQNLIFDLTGEELEILLPLSND